MVKSEDENLVPDAPFGRDVVQPVQGEVVRRFGQVVGMREKIVQFGFGRHGGRAGMARDDQRAASVAAPAADAVIRPAQPAGEEAGEKSIASAEQVEYFDARAGDEEGLVETCRDLAFDDRTTPRPQFDDEGGRRQLAHGLQGCVQILGAAGNVEFFFRADDEVEMRQNFLKMARDRQARDIARFAVARCCQPP